ncbi:MAG: hypothetical protein H0X73_01660 [Chthoniobacterales bacterium]|nr:hypothetical protein [Chthoniobacterales bacterium]
METGVQLSAPMRFQTARKDRPVLRGEGQLAGVAVTPVVNEPFSSRPKALRAILAGLGFTLVQLFITVVLIAPEGPMSYRYQTLVQHDSYWFANIVGRGYDTILPPITRKMMEVSNVAFFPAYPAIAAILHKATGIGIYNSLLISAQTAAWGFWSYFFLLCDRWTVRPELQFLGAMSVLAHPTAFFLIAAYSESLFLAGLLGFIYWSAAEGRLAKVIAAAHGIVMSATRIVGIPCAAYPVVRTLCERGWGPLRDIRALVRNYAAPLALTTVATFGGFAFFLYCLVRWGRWDLYMQTQATGWAIIPDYLAVLKPASYRWLIPAMDNPTQASQMTMTLGAIAFLLVGIFELFAARRWRTAWPKRLAIYFSAFVTFYLAVSGVASVEMESMLRYQFCAHALIVLALLHFLAQFRTPPMPIRIVGMAAAALLWPLGFSLQGWYVWNFTRAGWVA